VRAWNRSREKAAALAPDGVVVCDSPAEAVRGSDFVLTMLADGAAVESSMTGALAAMGGAGALAAMGGAGALAAMGGDAVWLQCSTVGLEATQRLAALAESAGVAFVDSPVLGTKKPAEDAKLVVLASGPAPLEEPCREVFDAIAQRTAWLGPAGTGTRLKLVMNSWALAVNAAVAEAVALAEGLGIDPGLFLATLEGSQLDTPYAHIKASAMMGRDFAPSFPTAGALKDAGLILAAARSCGMTADVVEAVRAKLERTVRAGHGDDDMAAAYYATAAK
jgi:3-hydroxyisobutyrate dehydrogenase